MVNKTKPILGGYVTSSKSFIGTQNKITPTGLFSEQIFGPVTSYCCSSGCRNYSEKKIYENQICPKCGGICGSNDLRYTTFGKINLTFPVIKPTKKKELLNIIGSSNNILLNPNRTDYLNYTHRYIGIKNDLSDIGVFKELVKNDNYTIIPFRITGLYSLYIVLKLIYKYFQMPQIQKLFDDGCIIKELYVLPPSLRLVIFDHSKKKIISTPINKSYTSILKYEERNSLISERIEQDENDIIGKIIESMKNNNSSQDILIDIISYEYECSKYQYIINEIYQYVITELSGKEGLIRNSILGRNIDFCARSVIRSDPSLKAHEIKVSKTILRKTWLLQFLHYLSAVKDYDYDYYYNELISKDEFKFHDEFEEFLVWMQNDNRNRTTI